MAHVPGRLREVSRDVPVGILKVDGTLHAREGRVLEHLWQNAADLVFPFRIGDLPCVERFLERVHADARREDLDVHLPHKTFLMEDS